MHELYSPRGRLSNEFSHANKTTAVTTGQAFDARSQVRRTLCTVLFDLFGTVRSSLRAHGMCRFPCPKANLGVRGAGKAFEAPYQASRWHEAHSQKAWKAAPTF